MCMTTTEHQLTPAFSTPVGLCPCRPDISTPAFSTHAGPCRYFHSCNFHPCRTVPMFPLPHFPPLQDRANVSTPAFSTTAFLTVPIFPLPHFQSPQYQYVLKRLQMGDDDAYHFISRYPTSYNVICLHQFFTEMKEGHIRIVLILKSLTILEAIAVQQTSRSGTIAECLPSMNSLIC